MEYIRTAITGYAAGGIGYLILVIVGNLKYRQQDVPADDSGSRLFVCLFLKPAAVLYRLCGEKIILSGSKHFAVPGLGPGSVEADLMRLFPKKQIRTSLEHYYIRKLAVLLAFFAAGDLLASAAGIAELASSHVDRGEIQILLRGDYGEPDQEILLSEGEDVYPVTIRSRRYTQQQCEEMARELWNQIPEVICGDNEDLMHVTGNLRLIKKAEGFPFTLSWESSRLLMLDTDGKVNVSALSEGEVCDVTLTVSLRYEDFCEEMEIPVRLIREPLSAQEKRRSDIRELILEQEEQSLYEEQIVLPKELSGEGLKWSEQKEDQSMKILLLMSAAGVCWYLVSDRSLHEKTQELDRQLQMDYPQVISKIVLLMGAGMSVRNVFYKLGDDYLKKRGRDQNEKYIYEEILLMCHEMDSGISENAALMNLSARCRSRQYSRMCALLMQHQKKGSADLLTDLREEAEQAFEDRKRMARHLAEEAGTKLLVPMMLMLGVTLVMILIPALFRFSL